LFNFGAAGDFNDAGDIVLNLSGLNTSGTAVAAADVVTATAGAIRYDLTGDATANTIVAGALADTITGGAGADTMTGGAGADTFVIGAGDSALTVALGGATTNSSVAGSDRITDFAKANGTAVSEVLNVAGTASVYAPGATVDIATTTNVTVNNSGTSTVFASLVVTNGVAVFHNNDTPGGATAITLTANNIAGAVASLQEINLGALGRSVGFMGDFDNDGTADDFALFTQGTADGATNSADTLVILLDTGSITSLITTNATTANALFIA
jgi:hypothetical protein